MGYYILTNFLIEISDTITLPESWNLFLNLNKMKEPLFCVIKKRDTPYIHQVQHFKSSFCGDKFMISGSNVMLTDEKYEYCQLILDFNKESNYELILHIFYTHAVQQHFIQVHSSLISYHGKGIMFLGPSGIGKTTQAELWHQYRNADIINGDLVFVEHRKDEFIGWGTPWHGSSPYCENASVPVVAWVVLKQSNQNTIRRLSGFEMVSEVAQSIFYPLWLENGTELCMQTLDSLLKEIPVYELSCRPDEESVQLLYDELSRNNILDL